MKGDRVLRQEEQGVGDNNKTGECWASTGTMEYKATFGSVRLMREHHQATIMMVVRRRR